MSLSPWHFNRSPNPLHSILTLCLLIHCMQGSPRTTNYGVPRLAYPRGTYLWHQIFRNWFRSACCTTHFLYLSHTWSKTLKFEEGRSKKLEIIFRAIHVCQVQCSERTVKNVINHRLHQSNTCSWRRFTSHSGNYCSLYKQWKTLVWKISFK